jgi:AcrR family transcriptional regulator
VEKYGVRRATMGDVASVAGIAKGTLYNHFRTKADLLTAAVCAGIEALADDCVRLADGRGADGLADALRLAAETLSAHPALVRVAAEEPAELVRLLLPSYDGGWPVARAAISRVLLAADPSLARSSTAGGPPDRLDDAVVAAADAVASADAASLATSVADATAAMSGAVEPSAVEDPAVDAPTVDAMAVADAAAVETVLRWLVTFTGSPGVPGETASGAALLASALVR